jgi:hypothetical protein
LRACVAGHHWDLERESERKRDRERESEGEIAGTHR